MNFLLRRLGFYLLAGFISLTLNFLLPRLAPGDPISVLAARFQGKLDSEALLAFRVALGDPQKPWTTQYVEYLSGLLHGNLGTSVLYFPAQVSDLIGEALLWTLLLAGVSVILSFGLGSLLGMLSAFRRGRLLDTLLPPLLTLLGAFPYFWLAMLLLYSLGFSLDWFPIRHAYDDHLEMGISWRFLASVVRHATLPALAIVLTSIGGWTLGMRNTMMSVLCEDYILMAQAKGLSGPRIMLMYAAKNAILPNITSFGMALGFVLSGSLLTEIVFSYPGQGYLLYQAVTSLDYPLIQGLFLTITVAVLGANFLIDIVYLLLDPRTRR